MLKDFGTWPFIKVWSYNIVKKASNITGIPNTKIKSKHANQNDEKLKHNSEKNTIKLFAKVKVFLSCERKVISSLTSKKEFTGIEGERSNSFKFCNIQCTKSLGRSSSNQILWGKKDCVCVCVKVFGFYLKKLLAPNGAKFVKLVTGMIIFFWIILPEARQ